MKILAVIPARGGSKGIKGKNIIDVAGKPLIAYTIAPALASLRRGTIQKLIVSTDSERIGTIAKGLGAQVPFLRPKNISADKSKSADVLLHAIRFFEEENIYFDTVMLLQPTAPLRTLADIESAVKLFKRKKADSLISCYRDELLNASILYHKRGDKAVAWRRDHNSGAPRQSREETFIRSGAIYMTRVDYLKRNRRIIAETPLLYEIDKSRSIDIDSVEDLKILRRMLCA